MKVSEDMTPACAATGSGSGAGATARPDRAHVKMEGYLEKRGKMRVVAMWKRYWFVLEGRLLLYYKSQQEYARLSPCRGSLNMGLASCVRPGAGAGPGADQLHHVLEVVLRSHVVSLRAKDRATQEQWLKALLDSMASSGPSPGQDQNRGPLHLRYPSTDNVHKAEGSAAETEAEARQSHGGVGRDKHRTQPQPQPPLVTVPEKATSDTPDGSEVSKPAEVHIAPRKAGGKGGQPSLARQGSILPMLAGRHSSPRARARARAVHPAEGEESESTPFGNQRYSFHGFCKAEETDKKTSPLSHVASVNSNDSNINLCNKPKSFKNLETALRKQLSFSSPSNEKEHFSPMDLRSSLNQEPVLKTTNSIIEEKKFQNTCKICKSVLTSIDKNCNCQNMSTPILEDEKENLISKWKAEDDTPNKFHPDENQNQLLRDFSFNFKRGAENSPRKYSGSERDLLVTSGVDLSFDSPSKHEFTKPLRCTSAEELWSPPRKNLKENYVKHTKFDYFGEEAQYSSATEIHHASNTLESRMSEPVGAEKKKFVKMSLRQRLIHGNGEYIKYSEPEDCDKRDSTLNTTSDSHAHSMKTKTKVRLRKRKNSTIKESYNLTDSCENGYKKRAPVRNRLSFLSRVLSHVRRAKSEDIMDHPESNGIFSDDAFLTPHPDLNSKCTTPVSRVLDGIKKGENAPNGSDSTSRADFQLGPLNPVFGEAPEEPPPDYDSVGMEPMMDDAGLPTTDEPPQLPPRRMKRPRSPWHDVPTNNSPIIDMDSDARQRLLSAAKYGRVIGTRSSLNIDFYDWNDSQPSDHSQHHAYEVVSDDTSPAGSNEHLAIYLSSESSDDEFHEEVILRRNIEDREFLFGTQNQENPFGNICTSSAMQPLKISTDMLPTLDSSGRVGLSHVEAVKLSLLMEAQKTSTDLVNKQKEEREKFKNSQESNKKMSHKVDRRIDQSDVLQQPPEEFADKDDCRPNNVPATTDEVMAEVQGLLSPVEKLLNSCLDWSENKGKDVEAKTIGNDSRAVQSEDAKDVHCEVPPQLPSKKVKGALKIVSDESYKRHSDELNDLLSQLASMTTAPLLPIGATCSLQLCDSEKEMRDPEDCSSEATKKQSLSLDAVSHRSDSEPDYDIPRPHASLFHILPQSGRPFPDFKPDDDGIVVEATHFFSRPESPRFSDDQTCTGHMSPDSLDFPYITRRSLNNWDVHNSSLIPMQDRRDSQKLRSKRDRNRRATLNGPIILLSSLSSSIIHESPLVRRNSIEIPTPKTESNHPVSSSNIRERAMNEPECKTLTPSGNVAVCDHNSSQFASSNQNYFSCNGALCKKLEVSCSLEDISEKSELNSDLVGSRKEASRVTVRTSARHDEVDMDSLETTEFKKLEATVPSALLSIVEEVDTLSDKSSDYHAEGPNGETSGSASEAAVMIGHSTSTGTDQQISHTTDSDMEMLSDDDFSQTKDCEKGDEIVKVIEPDSLLPESLVAVKTDFGDIAQVAESDNTKEVSFETDSLELKK